LTKSDLVDSLAREFPGITRPLARTLINLFLEAMKKGLAEGDTVEFRDFGVLRVHERAPRKGRNPKTGASVSVSAKKNVRFKQGRALKGQMKERLFGE